MLVGEKARIDEGLAKSNRRVRAVLRHHRTHRDKRLDFRGRVYLKALYTDDSPLVVLQKATQNGASEWLLGMKAITPAIDGRAVFYVMPTFQLASRFVKNRVDRTIEFTAYYKEVLRASRMMTTKQSESMYLKHLGIGSIAFAGSNTTSVFTEYPADDLVVDELDECDQGNLNMAVERLSAAEDKTETRVGQPSVSGHGMAALYRASDRKQWNIKCQACGRWVYPDFFKHVVQRLDTGDYAVIDKRWDREGSRDIRVICECGKELDRYAEGAWVRTNERGVGSGYHISKMFSTKVRVAELLERFEKGLVNDSVMQRFYNGDLGLPYEASGAKISLDAGEVGDHTMGPGKGRCLLGCDVGNAMYVAIGEVQGSRLVVRLLRSFGSGEVEDFSELAGLYRQYRCVAGVIDALPEGRLSKKFARSFRGGFYCFYGEVKRDIVDGAHKIITVERTQTIDAVKEALLTGELVLPREAEEMPELREHLGALTRVYDERRGKYVWAGDDPDHYLHAIAYMLVARRILAMAR